MTEAAHLSAQLSAGQDPMCMQRPFLLLLHHLHLQQLLLLPLNLALPAVLLQRLLWKVACCLQRLKAHP